MRHKCIQTNLADVTVYKPVIPCKISGRFHYITVSFTHGVGRKNKMSDYGHKRIDF